MDYRTTVRNVNRLLHAVTKTVTSQSWYKEKKNLASEWTNLVSANNSRGDVATAADNECQDAVQKEPTTVSPCRDKAMRLVRHIAQVWHLDE